MKRPKLIAGNWKMNLRRDSAVQLALALVDRLPKQHAVQVAVCPPAVYLHDVGSAIAGSPIALGGQDVSAEKDGAYTGEISVGMLKDLGCTYAIIGHSERRQYHAESDALINRKLKAAQAGGLIPIVCVGETLAQREAEQTESIVGEQLRGSLAELSSSEVSQLVIAYEPVWAIGTGRVATPDQAQAVHAFIRSWLRDKHGAAAADAIRIQYGGSVKPDNAKELLHQQDIDGALVGGASLKAEDFLAIIASAG